MFNLNAEITRQHKRRAGAIKNLKTDSMTLSGEVAHELKQAAAWNPIQKFVQERPYQSCAIAVGAGLLIRQFFKTPPASAMQPQRVVVEIQASGNAVSSPAAATPAANYFTQALAIFEAVQQMLAPAQSAPAEHNGVQPEPENSVQ